MMFTPVVDVSRHQGKVDFGRMRGQGVSGVIIRVAHARVTDDRFHEYVRDAHRGGYTDGDMGFYAFMNPRRGSPSEVAQTVVNEIRAALGHTDTLYMLDVEDYKNEPKDPGSQLVFGADYVTYLRRHIDEVRRLAPDMTIIAYTNKSYWNGPVRDPPDGTHWVHDARFAGELEFIVPRFPVLPKLALRKSVERELERRPKNKEALRAVVAELATWQRKNAPPEPSQWSAWALERQPLGPEIPKGALGWAGWQFSADWNGQGPQYGVAHEPSDMALVPSLDLNIVRTEIWERWTGQTGTGRRVVIETLTPGPDTLVGGQGLAPGEQRISKNGMTTLIHQTDGNVVVRKSNRVLFSTNTGGGSVALIMQTDGNLVLYNHGGAPLFHTRTHGSPGAGMRVENDGRVVVYSPALSVLWASDTIPDDTGEDVPGRRTAVVRRGDGWIVIAKRELGDRSRWREIARLNGGETRVLHEGDVIVLPA